MATACPLSVDLVAKHNTWVVGLVIGLGLGLVLVLVLGVRVRVRVRS